MDFIDLYAERSRCMYPKGTHEASNMVDVFEATKHWHGEEYIAIMNHFENERSLMEYLFLVFIAEAMIKH